MNNTQHIQDAGEQTPTQCADGEAIAYGGAVIARSSIQAVGVVSSAVVEAVLRNANAKITLKL